MAFLADLILFFHFLYVLGILIPIPLILIGAKKGWTWVRNSKIRKFHAGMILFVVFETMIGMTCPLTEWEAAIRSKNETMEPYTSGFISTWISKILFYEFKPWVFTVLYCVIALIIVSLYVFIPPKKSRTV